MLPNKLELEFNDDKVGGACVSRIIGMREAILETQAKLGKSPSD